MNSAAPVALSGPSDWNGSFDDSVKRSTCLQNLGDGLHMQGQTVCTTESGPGGWVRSLTLEVQRDGTSQFRTGRQDQD